MRPCDRAQLAAAVQEVYLENKLTKYQKSALKKIVKVVGESTLLDALMGAVSGLKIQEEATLSSIVTTAGNYIASDYIYHSLIDGLPKKAVDYMTKMLEKQTKYYNHMIERLIGRTGVSIRNIIPIIMKLDYEKLPKTQTSLRKLRSKEARLAYIEAAKTLVDEIRPVMIMVIECLTTKTDSFEIIRKSENGKSKTWYLKNNKPQAFDVNYMSIEPKKLDEIKCDIDLSGDSTCRRAVERTLNQPHTLDQDVNNAIMAIIDTPLFEKLIRKNNTDELSVQAKLEQTRYSIKEGIGFWGELGKGNVYFDYVVDFRGRINQIGGISAVGNKVGKAMLRSGVSYPLGQHGYDDILIALAGAMGHDKETFDERLRWARNNVVRFTDLGSMLLHSPDRAFNFLIKEGADEIFAAAAICIELHRIKHYHGDIRDYCSNLYIGYDATSSAVQLVGLMMGNYRLTEASNVRVGNDTEDKIHDAYMLMADSMDELAKTGEFNEEDAEFIKMWLDFPTKTKRAFAKPLLMTRLYGSTRLTWIDRSRDAALEKGIMRHDDPRLQQFGISIARLFERAFNESDGYGSLKGYERFIKEISKAYVSVGKHGRWNVYDGVGDAIQMVENKYTDYEGDDYRSYFQGKKCIMRSYNLSILTDCKEALDLYDVFKIDKYRAVSGIAPNFIHSHDALVLHLTVNEMGDVPMRLTHDCFACAPGKVGEMQDAIIKVYTEQFGNNTFDRLERLRDDCEKDTGVSVALPEEYNAQGIPIKEVCQAKYMFS